MASNVIEEDVVVVPCKGRPRVEMGEEKDFVRRAKRRQYYQRNKEAISLRRKEIMKGPKGDRIREHNRRASAKLRNRPAWERWRVSYYDRNRARILEAARQKRDAKRDLQSVEREREWCKYVEGRQRKEKVEMLRQRGGEVTDVARESWKVMWNEVVESIRRLPMLLSLGRSEWSDDVSVHTEFRRAVLAMTKERPRNMARVWMTEGVISPRAPCGFMMGRELLREMSMAHMTDLYANLPFPRSMMMPGRVPLHCMRFLPDDPDCDEDHRVVLVQDGVPCDGLNPLSEFLDQSFEDVKVSLSDHEDSDTELMVVEDSDLSDSEMKSVISDDEVREALEEIEMAVYRAEHETQWQKVMEELKEFMALPFTVQNAVMSRHRRHRKPVVPKESLEYVFMPIAAREQAALEVAKSEHRVKWKKVMSSLLEVVTAPFDTPYVIAPCRKRRLRSRGRPQGQAYKNVAEYVAEVWYNTEGY